jgi:putative ABC transport system permease protein
MMLLRKMAKNRWLVASLLAGMILSTALAGSMPTYKHSILQRMLVKELEQYHVDAMTYPGTLVAVATFGKGEPYSQRMQAAEQLLKRTVMEEPLLSPLDSLIELRTIQFDLTPADPSRVDPKVRRTASLIARSGLEDNVRLVSGRMPAEEPVNGVIEVLVTDRTLGEFKTVLETEFVIEENDLPPVRLKPVGVVEEDDLNSLYWDNVRLASYGKAFLITEETFRRHILGEQLIPLHTMRWDQTFDYRKLNMDAARRLLEITPMLEKEFDRMFGYNGRINLPIKNTLESYTEREARLATLLWSLNVPLMILIVFYLYMVSALLIERQKPEIAVLRSRGAGRLQVALIFAMESAFLSAIAFLAGPWVGAWFTRMLGSTSTFMNFVQRKSLVVEVTDESFLYAGGAACLALIINIIPVVAAARFSIVDQKRMSARQTKRSYWHLLGLDVVFLGLSLYGLYSFRRRMDDLLRLGLDSMEFGVDPLLFAVPALFVFGFGLLLLRLYPWIVRLIYWAGRSRWRPSLYSSLLLVARRSNQYHPLMLFLILTLGMSIFNVSAARTLNMNLEEQILYRYGADIVLQQQWQDDAPMIVPGMEPVEMPDPEEIHYLEPPFEIIESLPEVEHAAKVFVKDDVYARIDKAYQRVRLMAIETDEFGRTAWMKQGLLPYDFYEYLNLIAPNPHSVLISRTMAEQMEIGPGDTLEIAWEGEQFLAVVYGVIDYFPSFNPNPSAKKADAEKQAPAPMLVVAHLETVQNNLVLQPYDVWIKLKEGATAQQLVESLEEKRVILTKFIDVKGEIAQSRNDPFRMAINGVMSLGLVLSLMVSLTGFLLYWVLSMRARALQLGVLRAMGISFGGMVGMLAAEQLLTSGAGMLIGLISGAAAAVLFVPLFQLSFDPGQIVPPFEVWIRAGDTLQMVVIMLTMLAAALIALGILLKRLKIHQAVKLGED